MNIGLKPLWASLILLAGCNSTGMEITRDTIALKSKALPKERVLGVQKSVVRAYTVDANGKRTEVRNATCQIRSKELSGRAVSPQIVQYPVFLQGARFKDRGRPSNLTVLCKAGPLNGATEFEAITTNLSSGGGTTSYVNSAGQTTSVSIVAPIAVAHMSTAYPWRYDVVLAVDLK